MGQEYHANPHSLFWRLVFLAVKSPSGAGLGDETPKAVTVANGSATITSLRRVPG
jgi:hypothetical protein